MEGRGRIPVKPKGYRERIVDRQIERYPGLFGAVEVAGTKWCGKTWTSLAHAESVTYVDRGANLDIVAADRSIALLGERPHAIDEWQRVPAVWDVVRHAVDDLGGERGAWLLTGSSTPCLDETSHSGAGRIGRIRMWPMSLRESGESTGTVSLRGLFEGEFEPVQCTPVQCTPAQCASAQCGSAGGGVAELAEICCRGGWPGTLGFTAGDALVVVTEYLGALYRQTVPRMGGNPETAERLVRALARSLCRAARLTTLAQDVFSCGGGAGDDGSTPTDWEERQVSEHLGILKRAYVIDEVPGWAPAARSPQRVRTKPKRYFADPSIPVAALGMSPRSLLGDWQTFGLVFENLCMRDLAVYARALPRPGIEPLRYYRDDSDLEVDAIVEQMDGSWGAFEIKMGTDKVDAAASNLLRLRDKLAKDRLGRTPAPAFLAVLVGVGEAAYRRPDGVCVIPVRTLGA